MFQINVERPGHPRTPVGHTREPHDSARKVQARRNSRKTDFVEKTAGDSANFLGTISSQCRGSWDFVESVGNNIQYVRRGTIIEKKRWLAGRLAGVAALASVYLCACSWVRAGTHPAFCLLEISEARLPSLFVVGVFVFVSWFLFVSGVALAPSPTTLSAC